MVSVFFISIIIPKRNAIKLSSTMFRQEDSFEINDFHVVITPRRPHGTVKKTRQESMFKGNTFFTFTERFLGVSLSL
ncbi:hypothetical protein BDF21DRAFT_409085 [Thamnidium elegans]|nr:hypothetical protein BDF21DRAFT_409085 [Thamnidium elegans]